MTSFFCKHLAYILTSLLKASSRLHSRHIIRNWSINLFFCFLQTDTHLGKDCTRKIKLRTRTAMENNLLRVLYRNSVEVFNRDKKLLNLCWIWFENFRPYSLWCVTKHCRDARTFLLKVFSPQLDCLARDINDFFFQIIFFSPSLFIFALLSLRSVPESKEVHQSLQSSN